MPRGDGKLPQGQGKGKGPGGRRSGKGRKKSGPNPGREPFVKYVEMATRTDRCRRIDDPDGYGKRTGACGDTVEMFLIVRHNRIHKVFFVSDGCINTNACSNCVAFLAEGKSMEEAWNVAPEKVIDVLETLPDEHVHCAELAVGALYLALANFNELKHAPWKRLYGKPR